MTRRPLLSFRDRTPASPAIASATTFSISSLDRFDSMTSSRLANCTPILTSTRPPSVVGSVVAGLRDLLGVRGTFGPVRSAGLVGQREPADPPPGQRGHQRGGLRLVDLAAPLQPEPGA